MLSPHRFFTEGEDLLYLGVGELGQPAFAFPYDLFSHIFFVLDHLVNLFLKRSGT